MALSELTVKQAKPQSKEYLLHDDRGLYILVKPAGGKYWRLRYWKKGKETKISLGVYPDVSLKSAREKRDLLRRDIANGIDPKEAAKAKLAQSKETFSALAEEWFSKKIKNVLTNNSSAAIWNRLERYVLPALGQKSIREITAPDILTVLRQIEALGIIKTAHFIRSDCSRIFRYAIAVGCADRDPAADLIGALQPAQTKHNASVTDLPDVVRLLRAMDAFNGTYVVKCVLWFSAYTFARPSEVRRAEWEEIDFEKAEWKIPKEKMKKRRTHIVPLSKQTIEILEKLKPLTGHGIYVFPSQHSPKGLKSLSHRAVPYALRYMGFNKEMSAHGFRSMASTLLNEQGWAPDVIERQLAHVEGNSVRAAYNYAEYLPERRKMMQEWADYLDSLKAK
jgi:integrase